MNTPKNAPNSNSSAAVRLPLSFVAAGVLLLVPVGIAIGDTRTWTGAAGNGMFSDPGNWDPQMVPGIEETALFDLSATYTVFLNDDVDNAALRVRGGDVSLDIDEFRYRMFGSGLHVIVGVGPGDEATLRIVKGTLRNSNGVRLGDHADAEGVVYISGEDAMWHQTGTLHIGEYGTGWLHVTDGGTYQHSASSLLSLGRRAGSKGHLVIDGPGTTWWSGFNENIGHEGEGHVTIRNGGWASMRSARLGRSASTAVGTVTVTGQGTYLEFTQLGGASRSNIGEVGTGTLIIEQGATAAAGGIDVARRTSGKGTIIVRDPGTLWDPGSVRIGRLGIGEVRVENGAAITSGAVTTGTGTSSASGDVIVSGADSTWTVGSTGMFLGGSASSENGTGTLTLEPGGKVIVNNTFKMWEDSANTLTFVLAGSESGSDYGHLEIGGLMDLSGSQGEAGTLEIVLDNYTPTGGDSFHLFDFDTISGKFAVVDLPALPTELFWDTSALYTDGILKVGPDVCYADCDENGTLNIGDFLCFIDEFAVAQGLPVSEQIEHYANCTGSTSEPVLSIADFLCFIDEFALGCP